MKKLNYLLENMSDVASQFSNIEIKNITNNSCTVSKNTLFLAYPGEKSDGRNYIEQAVEKGAVAICYESSDDFVLSLQRIPCIPVPHLKSVQSTIAARFYDFPSTKVPVIGVTGTNGKTSVTHFIAQCLADCGVIGTVGYGFLSSFKKSINTTPDGLQLQAIFSEMVDKGAQTIAMEVSSHALSLGRVNDVQFYAAVFTNLTQDHLDFHHTMEKYRNAKELLFTLMSKKNSLSLEAQAQNNNAVINIDDAAGDYFSQKYKNKLNMLTYSRTQKNADIFVLKCTPAECGFDLSVKTPWGEGEFYLPLIGTFNIDNALATLGVLGLLKVPFAQIIKSLSQLKTVNGRMELLHVDNKPTVIVDYAHTPDALEKVLNSVRAHCAGKLWCVFGCGGDRDKTKRSQMGAIAAQLSDFPIITNDNPRSENPDAIARDILKGMSAAHHTYIELNRVEAITYAIQSAQKNDWIVIAGKGHETEQIIGDRVLRHSDSECALRELQSLKNRGLQ